MRVSRGRNPSMLAIVLLMNANGAMAALDIEQFAACLRDSGATFYGAHWCPYCERQNALFGGAQRLLPYVECEPPDGDGKRAECADVQSYPTWEFANGSRRSGLQSLDTLAQDSGCALVDKVVFVD